MKRPRLDASKLGAKLGVGVCVLGFVLIFFGWNGAASLDRVQSQFPYLISGGIAGLALVVIGAALIIVETSRDERESLRKEIANLREAIAEMGAGPAPSTNGRAKAKPPVADARTARFVAGEHSYHRPDCRLLEGRGELERVTAEDVDERGLSACRVCEPASARR
jgi:hypothetical protein